MPIPRITYFYVGSVERGTGRSYRWVDGYSTRPDGGAQPWLTKAEARRQATAEGFRAVFDEQDNVTVGVELRGVGGVR